MQVEGIRDCRIVFANVSSSHEYGMICRAETSSAQYRHRGKASASTAVASFIATAVALACGRSGRLARSDRDERLESPQRVRSRRLSVVLWWWLLPGREAGEGVQVRVRNAIDMRSRLQNPIFVDRDGSVVPPVTLGVSVGGNQRSRHCMLMTSWGPSSRWNRGWVHDLRLNLETHSGLVWSRLLSSRLHGLLDLACPGASSITRRGRVVDFQAV